eukprot:CAMPEP_0117003154 /NCGR_PEP_ID=MMETSP0472-20121206/4560_1 /TAXON_ID=693140 ORGANISM="Tiarina fusus, Strain LIS" /NCGR_SAMPLE_ID=MMETSP0472 /ASSEMBLY_ACC=CAM_ASM_000603 /LENGTH=156 /DNA_ID=CAMNT_0004703691 /DNA_START=95 /DNA_END=565 /DNA_ORIENTATION=-
MVMMTFFLRLCLTVSCLASASAWVSSNRPAGVGRFGTTTQLKAVETVSLASLSNHEEDGTKVAESVTKWLDQEWIPQQVHIDMAESAKKSYIACRESGRDDVGDILMQIADDLSDDWDKYNADAFVNAWDIANYVSDYLIKASGGEGCECSEAIMD